MITTLGSPGGWLGLPPAHPLKTELVECEVVSGFPVFIAFQAYNLTSSNCLTMNSLRRLCKSISTCISLC